MNLWDWIILLLVAAALLAAMISVKKRKGNTCGCGCASCPHRCSAENQRKSQ